MDRSLAAALTRPRHVVLSVLLFLALGGLGGFVVGAADASSTGEGTAGTSVPNFSLPEPRVGDRGVYEVRSASGRTIDNDYSAAWERRIGFEWLDDQVVRNSAGEAEWGNLVWLNVTQVVGQGDLETDDEVYAVRPGTHDAFAYLRATSEVEQHEDGDRSYQVMAQTGYQERSGELPCGFRNPLQGRSVDVPSLGLTGMGACDQARWPDDGRTLVAQRAAAVDGITYLDAAVFIDRSGIFGARAPYLHLVFRDDIPYPIQLREDGSDAVFVLSAFERGAGPAARTEPEVTAASPPRVDLAPLQAWGPDDSGVDHPFPASEAWVRARDDPEFSELRDFLDQHPGAYSALTYFHESRTDGAEGSSMRWTFHVTDGDVAQSIYVDRVEGRQSTVGPVPVPLPPLPPEAGPLDVAFEFGAGEVQDAAGRRFPDPSSVEGRLAPTVASMVPYWQAYTTADYVDEKANSWRVDVGCTYDWDLGEYDCGRSTIHAGTGFTQSTRDYPDSLPWPVGQPGVPADVQRYSHLVWIDLPGRPDLTYDQPYYYSDQRTDWRRAGQAEPVSGSAPSFPKGEGSLMPLTAGGLWQFPTAEKTAALGVGALLVSLLFYLKPALKAGFVGLFSRVNASDLLDDPTRALLLAAVEAEPGIHHQALVRLAGKGNGATEHHLQKLVAGGLVNRHRSEGYTCYFRAGKVDRRAMATAHLLKSPIARAVVEAATSRPGTSLAQVAREQGVSVPTVHYHAKRLQAAGLVRWEGGLHAADGAASLGGAAAAT